MKKIKWIGWFILGVTITCLLFVMISPVFSLQFKTVIDGSMEPAIKSGSFVCIQSKNAEEIKVGDIVVFHSLLSENPVCHRVIEIQKNDETLLFTKGDAAKYPDIFPVKEENLIGKVIFVLPNLGYLLAGLIFLLTFSSLLIVMGQYKKPLS